MSGSRFGASAWGSGYQGYSQNQNRFGPLAGSGQRQQQFGQQAQQPAGNANSRQGGGRGTRQQGWQELVQVDSTTDRPLWPLTCYCHQLAAPGQVGERRNDIEGDFCAEELRWAQVQAARQGASAQILSQEFQAARHAQQQAFQALARARQPASLGGGPAPNMTSFLPAQHSLLVSQQQSTQASAPHAAFGVTPATPFGQVVGAFGRNPSVAGQPSAFCKPATVHPTPFGSTAAPTAPFGSTAAISATFGSAAVPSASFGQQQPSQGAFGGAFGQPHGSQQPAQGSFFGSSSDAPTGFTVNQPANSFQQAGIATPPGNTGFGQTQTQREVSEEEKPWVAQAFEKGKIPDSPPPAVFCR